MIQRNRILTICVVSLMISSCINIPTFIDGSIDNNTYQNDYLSIQIPNGWITRKPGGHIILILQKQLKTNEGLVFPTAIMEAGTIKDNSFPTYFDNSWDLAKGCFESFEKNELYYTNDSLDIIEVNGMQLFFFETRLDNKRFNKPDLIQIHYYFNVDSIFFHLSLTDPIRFDELKKDYEALLKTMMPK